MDLNYVTGSAYHNQIMTMSCVQPNNPKTKQRKKEIRGETFRTWKNNNRN